MWPPGAHQRCRGHAVPCALYHKKHAFLGREKCGGQVDTGGHGPAVSKTVGMCPITFGIWGRPGGTPVGGTSVNQAQKWNRGVVRTWPLRMTQGGGQPNWAVTGLSLKRTNAFQPTPGGHFPHSKTSFEKNSSGPLSHRGQKNSKPMDLTISAKFRRQRSHFQLHWLTSDIAV